MKVVISKENTKLGRIANVSLEPILSCPDDVPCMQKCYARKSCHQYPVVRNAWKNNFFLQHMERPNYFDQIYKYARKMKGDYFRWHVGGDIPDQHYLENMAWIGLKLPRIHFLCFTKNHTLDFSRVPNNLKIIASMWPSWGDASIDLPKAWMQDGTEDRIPSDATQCEGHCDSCFHCWTTEKDTWFKLH